MSYDFDLICRVIKEDAPVSESSPSGAITAYSHFGAGPASMRCPLLRGVRHDPRGTARGMEMLSDRTTRMLWWS